MRTVGALRDAQKVNRRQRREKIRELMKAGGMDLQEANRLAGQMFDEEWNRLEQQAERNKVPGNRR